MQRAPERSGPRKIVTTPDISKRVSRLEPHLLASLGPWLTVRAITVIVILFADWLVALTPGHFPLHPTRFAQLNTWDAANYQTIAAQGYGAVGRDGLRFFPLYPLMGRVLIDIGLTPRIAMLLIANGAAFVLGAQVHHLVLRESGDEMIARRATWLMAVAPAAFVLVMGYSEAIFLCAAVGTMAALRSQRWGWATVLALAAGLARPVGLLLVVPALIEATRHVRLSVGRERLLRVCAVLGAPVGTALYLAWVKLQYGDELLPFSVQSNNPRLRGKSVDPLSTLHAAMTHVVHGNGGSKLVYLTIVLALVLTVVCFFEWPLSYAALAAVMLLESAAGTNLGSTARYVFDAFPLAFALASVSRRLHIGPPVVVISSVTGVVLYLITCLGLYIP